MTLAVRSSLLGYDRWILMNNAFVSIGMSNYTHIKINVQSWLARRDSNPDNMAQNHRSYR